MARYVGGRIVPTHGGVWDQTKEYETLTIVLEESSGDSYISKRPVPSGTAITEEHYWSLYSKYNAQITRAENHLNETAATIRSEMDQQVAAVTKRMVQAEDTTEKRAAAAENLSNQNRSLLENRMGLIEARQEANVKASTDASADYAAELVDARVDGTGRTQSSLGSAIRTAFNLRGERTPLNLEWESGQIGESGNPGGAARRIRSVEFYPVVKGSKLYVLNNLNVREIYFRISYYGLSKQFIATDSEHFNQNPVVANTPLTINIDHDGYIKLSAYYRYEPELTEELAEQLKTCFSLYTSEGIHEVKSAIDVNRAGIESQGNHFQMIARTGGAITTYPTRVVLDKTQMDMDLTIAFRDLTDTTYGETYMVDYTLYEEDGTTEIRTVSWTNHENIDSVFVERGQWLRLSVKYTPECETSDDLAISIIREAVVFYTSNEYQQIKGLLDNTANHQKLITALAGDVADTDYVTVYVSNNMGIRYFLKRSGTADDGETAFDSTTILWRFDADLVFHKRKNSYGYSTGAKTYSLDDVCEMVGPSCVKTIDEEKYIILKANTALCYNISEMTFEILGFTANLEGYIKLIEQRSTQLVGGILLEKSVQCALESSISTLDQKVEKEKENTADALATLGYSSVDVSTDFIIANKDLQNENTATFLWASDTHFQVHGGWNYGTKMATLREMGAVAEKLKSDFAIITGDVVNGYFPVAEQKENLVNLIDMVCKSMKMPLLIAEGNHDDNSWYASASGSSGTEKTGLAETLTNEQYTAYSMAGRLERVMFDADNPLGGYYYYDLQKPKIRVIVLNCEDIPYIEQADKSLKYYGQWTMGYQQKQLKWLAEKALQFKEPGWGVMFFQHNDSNMDGNTQFVRNLDCLNQMVDAFKNKATGTAVSTQTDFEATVSYDFSANLSDEVVAWFSGHVHRDSDELIDGIPHMTIINTFNPSGGGYDIVTVDRVNRKIYCKRFNQTPMVEYNREINY